MNGRPSLARWSLMPVVGLVLGLAACATPPRAPSPSSAPPPPPPKASAPADQATSQTPSQASATPPSAAPDEEVKAAAAPPAEDPASPPAPASPSAAAPRAGTVGDPALSDEERLAQLDQAFSDSLGAFDERLAREQVAVRQQQEAAAADRAARNAGRGAGGDGEAGLGAAWPPPPGQAGEDASADTGPGGRRGGQPSPGNRSGLPVPQDVADASGDDIVARQLREAAMAETDPELAKKLWDEYRDYKRKQR